MLTKNVPFIAVKATSAFSGIGILSADSNKVTFCYEYDGKRSRRSRSTIRYNTSGEPYFIAYGCREYLRDYMRV